MDQMEAFTEIMLRRLHLVSQHHVLRSPTPQEGCFGVAACPQSPAAITQPMPPRPGSHFHLEVEPEEAAQKGGSCSCWDFWEAV